MPPRPSIPPRSAIPQRETLRIEGTNFAIEVHADGIAKVRVWRRPDLSRDEGARCAEELAAHMQRLVPCAHACVFNMSQAAPTWGPVTHQALHQMLAPWEAAAKPIFIIHANEAINRILLRGLLRAAAPL